MDGDEDDLVNSILVETRQLDITMSSSPNNWSNHITLARTMIRGLERLRFFHGADRIDDQVLVVTVLQRVAYQEPDTGGVRDIADWCMAQWLRLLQNDSEKVQALEGIGQAWLSRAQSTLARIHRQEGSSSSGNSSGRPGTGQSINYTSSDEARDNERAIADADTRMHTADYVEARGILLPSTEYFARAVAVAESRGNLAGDLLTSAAEAFMSLGNVSYSSANELYFRQALLYLRQASQLPNYRLSSYLQHYLDEYGRLVHLP